MGAIVYKNNIKLLICLQSKLQGGEPMDRWINGSIGSMDGWFNGLMNGSIYQSIYWSMDWWIYRSMDRSING